jgi:hypothetical protein
LETIHLVASLDVDFRLLFRKFGREIVVEGVVQLLVGVFILIGRCSSKGGVRLPLVVLRLRFQAQLLGFRVCLRFQNERVRTAFILAVIELLEGVAVSHLQAFHLLNNLKK